jgi:hypothetical protein
MKKHEEKKVDGDLKGSKIVVTGDGIYKLGL